MKNLTVVLHNIRSTYNVGAILRTAECLGVKQIVYSGYTPRYDDPRLLPHLRKKLNHQINKSAVGAEALIPQIFVEDLPGWLAAKQNALRVGLENNLSSAELPRRIFLDQAAKLLQTKADFNKTSTPDPREIILLLGEEVSGIPPTLRDQMDYFLEIPLRGRKESLNVSVAAAIALWELLK